MKFTILLSRVGPLLGNNLSATTTSYSAAFQSGGLYAWSIDNSTDNVTMKTILRELFKGYDKALPPKYEKVGFDRQVEVAISVFVHSMFSLSETNMEYSISMFLRERWIDPRLRYNTTVNMTCLELERSYFDSLWMPDMYILNEKESDYHKVTVPNKMIHVYPDGTVQYSAKVTGIFSCMMYLQVYPFDTQTCIMEFESYGHSTESMKFVWNDNPISITTAIKFPQFTLSNVTHYVCERDYYGVIYPCIGLKFVLERKYVYYIVQIYLPSILIVILSWVNFWLDCTAVPARITVGLLTVLTMTTQTSGARDNLPRVSYIKAIDVYMATCLAFVSMGLLEFAFVNVLTRADYKSTDYRTKTDENLCKNCRQDIKSLNDIFWENVKKTGPKRGKRSPYTFRTKNLVSVCGKDRIKPNTLDKISRVLFPLTFILFNLFYWTYYFFANRDFEGELS